MKALFRLVLIIGAVFAATFLLVKTTGSLSVGQIETWLNQARTLSPALVATVVFALLFADLFVAVPTMTVTILSGFFLGHALGSAVALAGLMAAGICGYGLGRVLGSRILAFLVPSEAERDEARETFRAHGFVMILLSRAVPILPEVTACLAGMTGMRFTRFLLAWSLSTIPYALIAAFAGSVSSLANPKPALFTPLGLSATLWLAWFVFSRHRRPVTR